MTVRSSRLKASDRARRLAMGLLMSRIRWLAVPLGLAASFLWTPPPLNRTLTVGVVGVLAVYNLAVTLCPRLPPRWVDPILLLAAVGDFVVVLVYMFAMGRDPMDLGSTDLMLIGAGVAVLYGWRGVLVFLPPMVLALLGRGWWATPNLTTNSFIDFSLRVFQVVTVTVIVAGLNQESERRRELAEGAKEEAILAREELTGVNRDLQRANELKSAFLANMSHELRTPLSAIIGFAEVLREGVDGPLNRSQLEDLEQIHSSGQSLLELITDLLDLSRIEAGKAVVSLGTLSMPGLIRQVMAEAGPLASAKSLLVEADVEMGPGSLARGDRARIHQVLTYLVSNAIKFTAEGGVTLGCRQRGDYVEVSVTDTGIGIPPELLDSIFGEFNQADTRSTRRYGGTGLGLAISRRLVEMHQGSIGVESEVGRGSRFWFRIPVLQLGAIAERVIPVAVEAQDMGARHPSPSVEAGSRRYN